MEGVEGERFRFAAADGASASSYSRVWARQLVRGFVTGRLREDNLAEALATLGRRWARHVRGVQGSRPLPWYAEQKLEKGAFAALVGLEIEDGADQDPERWGWRALAVGDSCLIHMRRRNVECLFPIDQADSFGITPVLLPTDAAAASAALSECRITSGSGVAGDRFYLMTDALAQWFLRDAEGGGEPWFALDDFVLDPDAPPFREWVEELRSTGCMRDDDVTLLRIEVER